MFSGLFSKSGTLVRGMTIFATKRYEEIPGIAAYACTPSPWEVEVGKFGLQGRALLHGESEDRLGYKQTLSQNTQSDAGELSVLSIIF